MSSHAAPRPAASLGLLLLRVAVGVVFLMHGAQKIFEYTIPGTVQAFSGMGAPLPEITAPVVAVLEFAGGILLIGGLFTRLVALLLAADMVVAIALVHLPAGFWVGSGGYEFVLILAAAALALALTGGGRFALDRFVLRGKARALA